MHPQVVFTVLYSFDLYNCYNLGFPSLKQFLFKVLVHCTVGFTVFHQIIDIHTKVRIMNCAIQYTRTCYCIHESMNIIVLIYKAGL